MAGSFTLVSGVEILLNRAVFILNVSSAGVAHVLLEKLPLGVAGMMAFDFVELGPITPLRFLLPLNQQ